MKIAITGAGGFLGTALTEHLSVNYQVLALGRRDLDVTDRRTVMNVMLGARPSLLINCAVVGVDACEAHPALARAVNADAPGFLAEAAEAVGAEFLHISTNYVFGGERDEGSFYTFEDEPAPVNLYGETKLAGERAASRASSRCYIARTSWVFGPGEKNFMSTACRRLSAGEHLRATADTRASATYFADFIRRVSEVLRRRRYGVYHIVNRGVCSYYEFAVEAARALRLSDAESSRLIEAVSDAGLGWAARRPRYTPMRCLMSERLGLAPLRDWREALADHILEHLKTSPA